MSLAHRGRGCQQNLATICAVSDLKSQRCKHEGSLRTAEARPCGMEAVPAIPPERLIYKGDLNCRGTPEGRQPEWGCVLKCEAAPAVGSQPISSQAPDAGQRAAGFGRFLCWSSFVYFLLCLGSSILKLLNFFF